MARLCVLASVGVPPFSTPLCGLRPTGNHKPAVTFANFCCGKKTIEATLVECLRRMSETRRRRLMRRPGSWCHFAFTVFLCVTLCFLRAALWNNPHRPAHSFAIQVVPFHTKKYPINIFNKHNHACCFLTIFICSPRN